MSIQDQKNNKKNLWQETFQEAYDEYIEDEEF